MIDAIEYRGEVTFDWKIKDFFSLSNEEHYCLKSPVFRFEDLNCQLWLYPNEKMEEESGWVGIFLQVKGQKAPKTFYFTLGIKGSDEVEKKSEYEFDFFERDNTEHGITKCWSRKELTDRRSALVPNDVLTVTFHLRSEALSTAEDNDLLRNKIESLMERVECLQKATEDLELELENYQKQISASESIKELIKEIDKCLLEEKSNAVSDKALSEKEVETLREQIKNLEKTIENYELESEKYKKQIGISETEKTSLEEKYKCLLEEKIITVSGHEKDNDLLRNKIETLMERIEILQKATENFELESEKYQKRISSSESEKALIEEKYKCLLEENSNTVSRLLKALCFGALFFVLFVIILVLM